MRFTAEREAVMKALSFVAKYAAQDNKIPILANVMVRATPGAICLTATNADQAASDSFPAEVEQEGAICIPASLWLKTIKATPGAEVSLAADDRQATVAVGKSKFKLPILPASDFPEMAMLTHETGCVFLLPASLLARVEDCVALAVEPPNGRFYLTGVSWRVETDRLEFCATDGKKLSLLTADAPASAKVMSPIIVPDIDIPEWNGDVRVSVSAAFIRYDCGSQMLASKLIEGSYPDYRRIIPANNVSLLLDREDLLASLSRVSLVADAREHSILFIGRNGKVAISAVTSTGEVHDELPYHGDDFQIAIVHHVLSLILSSFDCETIEMRYADHATGVTIHDLQDASRTAFVMPYRDRRLAEFIEFREAAE